VTDKFVVSCYLRLTVTPTSSTSTSTPSQPGSREIARQAVRRQIAEVAKDLFAEHGYEATTIDQIAAAVGMSQRSVFRYFPTKEDIVIGKIDYFADDLVRALRERPADEPAWESLRRIFDLADPSGDPGGEQTAAELQRIVFDTPSLLGRYLEQRQRMQEEAAKALRERAADAGKPYAEDDPAPEAIAAAAFGCLVAAQRGWLAGGAKESFAATLDRAMASVGPAG
jgi:AcrR family transcriptional regulator